MRFADLTSVDQVFGGNAIDVAMDEHGLNLTDIAGALHVDDSVVSLWHVNRRNLPGRRLTEIATALRMTPDELVENSQVRLGGYTVKPRSQAHWPAEIEAAEEPSVPHTGAPRADLAPMVPTSVPEAPMRLAWCESDHGTGTPPRRHHHGPLPSWAPGPPLVLEAIPSLVGQPKPLERVRQPNWDTVPVVERKTVAQSGVVQGGVRVSRCTVCGEVRPMSGQGFREHQERASHRLAAERG